MTFILESEYLPHTNTILTYQIITTVVMTLTDLIIVMNDKYINAATYEHEIKYLFILSYFMLFQSQFKNGLIKNYKYLVSTSLSVAFTWYQCCASSSYSNNNKDDYNNAIENTT